MAPKEAEIAPFPDLRCGQQGTSFPRFHDQTEGIFSHTDANGNCPPWEELKSEVYQLGLGEPVGVSAEHGEGLLDLFEVLQPFGDLINLNKAAERERYAKILEAKEGSSPWSLQINFASKQTIVPGGRYRYRFCIKADRTAEMGANCIQDQKPWAMIGNSQRNFTVTTSWQEISREFTAKSAYEGVIRSPMLMAGKLPKGTRFLVGGVKLEKVVNFLPLALNPKWTLFFSPELKSVSLAQVRSVPETLGGVAGRTVELRDGVLDVTLYGSSPGEKRPAVLFNEFEAKEDGVMQIGCAADYWLRGGT